MKSLSFLLVTTFSLSATPENPLIPDTWFQEITATDGSTQQCIIFTTIAGVEYTFYHSNELEQWTEIGKTYGLGQQFSAAMRETAPAPPPPDPQNPPPPGPVLEPASITIQPSSDIAGGTVVSWPSLDHGNAVQYLITGNMVAAWDSVPLFAEIYGTHQLFISHPSGSTAPPAAYPILDTKDAAMIADLEAAWSTFNTSVTTAQQTAINTPPPPPPAPDAKGFWRIKADWSLDSDGDGSPDHLEFANAAANGAGANGLIGNAFIADTNGNGIPDGEELDGDKDGSPDVFDVAPLEDSIGYKLIRLPRYAVFPITNNLQTDRPFQINDRGEALFTKSLWRNGAAIGISGLVGTTDFETTALSINNNGAIVGHIKPTGNEAYMHYWTDAASGPAGVSSGSTVAQHLAHGYGYPFPPQTAPGSPMTGISSAQALRPSRTSLQYSPPIFYGNSLQAGNPHPLPRRR